MIKVKAGVRPLRTATTELLISVSEKAKRNDGKKVPKKPVNVIHFHCSLDHPRRLLKPTNKRIIVVIRIREAPNCTGLRPTKPFLIKIYELPHIKESMRR